QIIEPAASTWGENGYLAVWLDPNSAWIYPHLNAAALRMSAIARSNAAESIMRDYSERVLKQLTRELLLAQSRDWAFLMKTWTAREYATHRTIDHLDRFNRLHDQFVAHNLDEQFLRDCEWRDNIFPNVNWGYYALIDARSSPVADCDFGLLRRFCRNRRGTRIDHTNSLGDAGRISFSLEFAGTICAALAHSRTNAVTLACKKRPHQFRSSADGGHDQPWDL